MIQLKSIKWPAFALLAILVILPLACWWRPLAPPRVHRQHLSAIPDQYQYLTVTCDITPSQPLISRKNAQQDLDQLEWLLEHRYAYCDRKQCDYRAALDAIRLSLPKQITRADLAYCLQKVMALFGDGHCNMASSSVSIKNLCSRFLPFLVAESNGRFVAFRPDRTAFLEPDYPFLRTLDGLPVETWRRAADIFLAAFKGVKNITLMGQPSGGGSGARIKYRLKHSLIAVNLSSMASFRPDGRLYEGLGITPDVPLEPEPEYFIGKSDHTLTAALHLLKQKTNPKQK